MSFKDSLKNFGFLKKDADTDEEIKLPKKTVQSSKTEPTVKSSPMSISSTPEINVELTGAQREECVAYFKKVFEDNNIPGPDYQEFFMSLEKMKTKAMDERTKFEAVNSVFSAQGVTPQKLVKTANFYKELFSQKKSAFDTDLQSAVNKEVGERQKAIEALATQNQKIDAQMKTLNDQKIANDEKAKTLDKEIQENSKHFKNQQEDFTATYNDMVGEIDKNIGKITEYLINTPS